MCIHRDGYEGGRRRRSCAAAEEVEKDGAEGTVPETARGCLLRTRRASNGGVTRSTQSDGEASCPGYQFPVRFLRR